MRVLFLAIAICFSTTTARGADSGGLNITGTADIVGTFGSGVTNRLNMREAEFMLYAPIDHYFDGTIGFAAHNEGGNLMPEVHGAFLESSKLIPRSRFRVGQFFLGFGRLQQFHRHDWPFITAPKYHQTFFGEEGVLDTGAEYTFLFPTSFVLDLTVGVTNGWIFGHAHNEANPTNKPLFPTHYVRASTYLDLPGNGGAQFGLNYIGRRDNQATGMLLWGVDMVAKWREAKVVQMLLQSEFWYRSERPEALEQSNAFGFYLYPEYYLGEDIFAGLRFDYYSQRSLKDPFTGNLLSHYEIAVVPTFSWAPSEFSKVRLGYTYSMRYDVDRFTEHASYVELQAIFILGAHPAHDF